MKKYKLKSKEVVLNYVNMLHRLQVDLRLLLTGVYDTSITK